MGPYNASENKAYFRMVFATLAVLGVMAALNVLIIMNALGTNVFKPLKRNIAAVTAVQVAQPVPLRAPIIEINCHKKLDTLKVTTEARNARVFFKNCEKIGRLVNESNNNQGDVFPLKKNLWTSDFISLNEGRNSIKAPLGEGIQIIEITREIVERKAPNKAL